MGLVVTREELKQVVRAQKEQNKIIVTTNGCFDILHVGHVRYLAEARRLGDVLIVGVNTDDSVRRLKGPSRPVNNENDRAEVLASLECVDYVTLFPEDTPVELLTEVKPNFHAKGGDYDPEKLAETPVVESFGGQVKIINLVPGKSTTSLIAKIDKSKEKSNDTVNC
ncbi:MAG: D-glycero-beta-D-manno-heptose 1-phosphate adenylyltransferase [Cyanobacteria bacterium SZAS LIN-5]|jgi:D-glycero-beta-D-manno-heptose 1-phosphate adenylyltransferase|nr:D-glycero-beta-D-manno-heptose 1-phosphate adenylyltransferase [Cyanobacteria bacterium SZAS LIN-5]RTL43415.1 MAG: D-glycero-beta-D-manno-heptose 1-phosphate adenylyltransferase [Candidatus Melainabacteria bacterium]